MGTIASKLFRAQSSGNEDLERRRAFLRNYVDPDHGLLDRFLNIGALERDEVAMVRAKITYFERNSKLMDYIFSKRKEEALLLALKDSGQNHIANYLQRNGVYDESCGECWPLTESQISTLDVNEMPLKELLDLDSGLLDSLYSKRVINNWQRQTISSNVTDFQKIQALLDILRRRSKGDYKETIHCLRNNDQGHIAQILDIGEAIVRIHSQLRNGQQGNERTETAIIASFIHTLQNANLGQTRSIQILNRTIEVIALMRVQSIDIYVVCKTSDELEQLKEMQSNGKLANVISSFFVQLLKSAQVKKLEVSTEDLKYIKVKTQLYDEENERCMAYLSNKDKQENERIRNRVVAIYEEFVSKVNPKKVVDFLIQNKIVNLKQMHHLTKQVTTEYQCKALLDLMFSCSKDNVFIILKEALKEYYPVIVERIDSLTKNDEDQNNSDTRSTMRLESSIIVFGKDYRVEDAFKINLNLPDEVSDLQQFPLEVEFYRPDMVAAVYCGLVFVTGIGCRNDEIWNFDARSFQWNECANLKRGRSSHSVAFVDHILYICGGRRIYPDDFIFDDVEAYDAIDDKCSTVGKLAYAVLDAGNCVSYKASLYIFGGRNTPYKIVNSVQVYNTKLNSCTILTNSMPRNEAYLRAALLKKYVVLMGEKSCFLYNFDTETWEVRDQFKTGVECYGVTVHNEQLFVIGGRDSKRYLRDEVRYVPILNILSNEPIEWKHHAKLPKPSAVYAFGKLEVLVKQI